MSPEKTIWTTTVILFIDVQDSVQLGRHAGPRKYTSELRTAFKACVEEATKVVLHAELPPDRALSLDLLRRPLPDIAKALHVFQPAVDEAFHRVAKEADGDVTENGSHARRSKGKPQLSPAYRVEISGDECFCLLTDFHCLEYSPEHELWDATDPRDARRMPPYFQRSRQHDRALGLSLERAMRLGRMVKLLWAAAPHNINMLLARQIPGALAMGVHVGPVEWSCKGRNTVEEVRNSTSSSGDGVAIEIDSWLDHSALSISYAKRVETASRDRSFMDAAMSSQAYASFRRANVSGVTFGPFKGEGLRGLRDGVVLWEPVGVRPFPYFDCLALWSVYNVWRALRRGNEYIEPFWGPLRFYDYDCGQVDGRRGDDWEGTPGLRGRSKGGAI